MRNTGTHNRMNARLGWIPFEATRGLHFTAKKDEFWGYAAGTLLVLLTRAEEVLQRTGGATKRPPSRLPVGGFSIDNYKTTLPVGKGLSSSAAVCVLVARAVSVLHGWQLSHRAEMEFAYLGERQTPSRCGRMDQACAFGKTPVLLVRFNEVVCVRQR